MPRDWLRHPVRRELVQPVLSRALIRPVRSTPPSPQACRVAVEDRSAGFAHATKVGCANHRIRVTEAARHKHICASSERRAATDARRVRQPKLRGASFSTAPLSP